MADYGHITVLLDEAVNQLNINPSGIYVDATLGGGGHSALISKQLTDGKLLSFDQDKKAIAFNQTKFAKEIADGKVELVHANFENLTKELNERQISAIDGIVFDLGVSSPQFDEEERGFSYRFDSKLDMRMNQEQGLSAYQVVNDYSQEDLANLIFHYGDEKYSRQIAKQIVQRRPIETTFELVEAIKAGLPNKVLNAKGHPAKKTFQAIRIEVNDELNVEKSALEQAAKLLKPQGRISVITFHSLEDRIAKQIFNQLSQPEKVPSGVPLTADHFNTQFELVNKKPIVANDEELQINPRAHSAKLRVLKRK